MYVCIISVYIIEKLTVVGGDSEDTESGFIESQERLDSGIPSSISGGCRWYS